MFFYNQEHIANEIKNYLFAINNELDTEVESPFTGEKIAVSEKYFDVAEIRLLGDKSTKGDRIKFRNNEMRLYVAKTIHSVHAGEKLEETKQFTVLQEKYNQNLKQNVLAPFMSNDNFRRAIKDFGTESFKNYDKRIRNEVAYLIKNLKEKFNYSEKGAKQACIYVVDKKLASSF